MMELITLSPNFEADDIIEDYESLIWSERYFKNGDFQLVSKNISQTINDLSLGSYVSLRESTVPMVVDSHKIVKDKTGIPVVTTTGISFEMYALKKRASVSTLASTAVRGAWTLGAHSVSDAAYRALRIVVGDQARYKNGMLVLDAVSPAVSPRDIIPEINLVLPADFNPSTATAFEIPAGELYKTVTELVAVNRHGIKATRPFNDTGKVDIEIYNGANLLTGPDPVFFDARFDQFTSATYLLSTADKKDVAYVYGPNGSQQVLRNQGEEPTGLNRNVLLVDNISDGAATTVESRRDRGLVELYQNNAAALFDGEIGEQVASDFNKRYFLGDIIELVGEYGLSQKVRVVEFIRTFDNNGVNSYPTFEAIDAAT